MEVPLKCTFPAVPSASCNEEGRKRRSKTEKRVCHVACIQETLLENYLAHMLVVRFLEALPAPTTKPALLLQMHLPL